MRKSFKYRLRPTPAQANAMQRTLDECRWLYNHLLEQRKTAYEERGETLTLYGQQGAFPALKAGRPSLASVHSQVLQNVAVRLDLAFKAFFRRVEAGETSGYPRFRGYDRYDSFCYPQFGFALDADACRVKLSKIGGVRVKLHRPLEGTVKTCCVKRTATGKWYITFSCEVEPHPSRARLSHIRCPRATPLWVSTWDWKSSPRSRRVRPSPTRVSSAPMRRRWRKLNAA